MTLPHRRTLLALILMVAPSIALAQTQSKLSGTVVDSSGGPAANVRVRLQPTGSEGVSRACEDEAHEPGCLRMRIQP